MIILKTSKIKGVKSSIYSVFLYEVYSVQPKSWLGKCLPCGEIQLITSEGMTELEHHHFETFNEMVKLGDYQWCNSKTTGWARVG